MKKETRRSIRIRAKNLVLCFSLLLTVAIASAAPPDPDPVNEEVKVAFKKEFPGAQVLSWSDLGELVKATFLFAGYRSEAYFSPEGELQGSVRNIFYNQVPLAVSKSVDKRFSDAEVLEVSEITNGNGTRYLLRLETKTKKYKVQMDAGGESPECRKTKEVKDPPRHENPVCERTGFLFPQTCNFATTSADLKADQNHIQ